MKKLALTSLLLISFGVQHIFGAPPVPDITGKISAIMLRPASSGLKTAVRIYFSSISGTDRFSCNSNPGYVEITDDNSYVSTGRLNQMLSLALAAQSSGNTFAVDFNGSSANAETCKNGTFAYIFR